MHHPISTLPHHFVCVHSNSSMALHLFNRNSNFDSVRFISMNLFASCANYSFLFGKKKYSKLKLYSCCLQRTKLHKSIPFIIQKHSMQRKHIYRRHLIEIEKQPLKLSVSTFYWLLNSKKKKDPNSISLWYCHNNLIYDEMLKRIDYFFFVRITRRKSFEIFPIEWEIVDFNGSWKFNQFLFEK